MYCICAMQKKLTSLHRSKGRKPNKDIITKVFRQKPQVCKKADVNNRKRRIQAFEKIQKTVAMTTKEKKIKTYK